MSVAAAATGGKSLAKSISRKFGGGIKELSTEPFHGENPH